MKRVYFYLIILSGSFLTSCVKDKTTNTEITAVVENGITVNANVNVELNYNPNINEPKVEFKGSTAEINCMSGKVKINGLHVEIEKDLSDCQLSSAASIVVTLPAIDKIVQNSTGTVSLNEKIELKKTCITVAAAGTVSIEDLSLEEFCANVSASGQLTTGHVICNTASIVGETSSEITIDKLTCKTSANVECNTSSELYLEDIESPQLSLVQGTSTEVEIESSKITDGNITIGTSGILTVEGETCNSLSIDLGTKAEYKGFGLETLKADITQGTSSACAITVENELSYKLGTSASLLYKGKPIIIKSEKGTGAIVVPMN